MSYSEVLEYLYEHLPYYQRKGPAAYKGSLDNTLALTSCSIILTEIFGPFT